MYIYLYVYIYNYSLCKSLLCIQNDVSTLFYIYCIVFICRHKNICANIYKLLSDFREFYTRHNAEAINCSARIDFLDVLF